MSSAETHSSREPATIKEAAAKLADTVVAAQTAKQASMDNIFAWLKQNPEAAGALLGVGGGALYGGLSSLFQDEEERAPLQSALTGALGGGLLGLGGGLAYRHLPGLLSRYGGEEKPLPNNPWSEMLGENKPSPAQGKLPVEAPWDPREFSFSPSPDFDPKPPESVIQKVEALSGGDPVIRAKLMGKWRDASQQTFDNDLADKMPDVVTPAVAGGAIGGGLPLAHKGWRAMRPANWKDLVRGIGENNPDTDLAQLRESVQNRPAVGNAVVGNVRKSMLGELTPKIPFRPSQRAGFLKTLWRGATGNEPTSSAGNIPTSLSKGYGGTIPSGLSRHRIQGLIQSGKKLRPSVGGGWRGIAGRAAVGSLIPAGYQWLRGHTLRNRAIDQLNSGQ